LYYVAGVINTTFLPAELLKKAMLQHSIVLDFHIKEVCSPLSKADVLKI